MKKLFLLTFIFVLPFLSNAQTVTATKHANDLNFKAIDVEPQFPGGTKAFNKYLSKNVRYPAGATSEDMNGSVTLTMAIEKDGTVADVKIVNGLSELMNKETIRLMTASPRWKPGMQRDQPIRVRYTFTINYALISDKHS